MIHDCGLEYDIQILPQGDLSKAGLRGINLSGGQRQRLNVARAAYFNGDVVLLDNALSALDHHTAHQVFNDLLKTSMAEKAVVLITHQVGVWVTSLGRRKQLVWVGGWGSGRVQQHSTPRQLLAIRLMCTSGC